MDSVGKPVVGAACFCSVLATLWRLEALLYHYNIAQVLRGKENVLSRSGIGAYIFVVGKAMRKDPSDSLVEAEQSKQPCLYYETTLLRVIDSITRSKQSGSYSRKQARGASIYRLTGLTDLRPSKGKTANVFHCRLGDKMVCENVVKRDKMVCENVGCGSEVWAFTVYCMIVEIVERNDIIGP